MKKTKIPLQIALITPFVIQMLLAVGLTGYLSFKNGQQAVNNVAYQLQNEISARVQEHLRLFLHEPHEINQASADAVELGLLNVNDSETLQRYFLKQINLYTAVSSVYFGNTAGGLVDAGRESAAGPLYIITTANFAAGPFEKYAVNNQGSRAALLTKLPNFDARARAWYKAALSKGGPAWSAPYILFTGQDMAISASLPVYNEHHRLLGVFSSDIFLSRLDDFLKSLDIGKTGQSFIVDSSGKLIASSTDLDFGKRGNYPT